MKYEICALTFEQTMNYTKKQPIQTVCSNFVHCDSIHKNT
ncbi:hypothetical protein bcere0022_27360 [Bacillus cereus Rock3-44]|nr:hypothetical protein bcere0022_27360 [Bacillus cereus Rock3-44]